MPFSLLTLAQQSPPEPTFGIFLIVERALAIIVLAGIWKAFAKAGQPGWAAIIPIYNIYVMCKIAGRPGWWVILFLIPIINILVAAVLSIDVAKSFGKSTLFGVGLWLLSFIFWPILGFGPDQYQGPAAA